MIPVKFTFQKRKVIIEVSRVTQNIRIWCATGFTKKGTFRVDCWTRKKKQLDTSVVEQTEGNEEQCDVLSVTDRPVSNTDRWVIDSGCSQHISSNRKMFFSCNSGLQGEFCYK